jgi:membrane protein implicated in regulation of membrane protease activity
MDVRPGYLAAVIAVLAALPAAVMVLNGAWLALGTFACIAVIGVFLWYLFDGREPDPHASRH